MSPTQLATMEERLIWEKDAKKFIANHYENFKKNGQSNMTAELARSRVERLKKLLEDYIANDQALRECEDADFSHEYFQENRIFEIEDIFDNVMDKYVQFLKVYAPPPAPAMAPEGQPATDPNTDNNNFNPTSIFKSLPQISLPVFSGDVKEWPHFRDMFTSVIHSQKAPAVIKLNYLRSYLQDEALNVIKNIPISEENYEASWDTLKLFYENERRLVHNHLSDLFAVKPMSAETYVETKRVLNETIASLDALEVLGRPTKQWSDLIVFMLVKNMHKNTRRDFEKSLGESVNTPTFERVRKFLQCQASIYESMERSTIATYSSTPAAATPKKSSASTSLQTSTNSPDKTDVKRKEKATKKCLICGGDHYISKCSKFLDKTLLDKRAFIKENKICHNCLGPHLTNVCKSKYRCSQCRGLHHTLLHDPSRVKQTTSSAPQGAKIESGISNLPITPVQNFVPQQSTYWSDQATNYTTFNGATQYGDCRVGVLLATARIYVVGPNGRKVRARALIDNCSQPSFISEKLSKFLQLPTTPTQSSVSAVGGFRAVSAKEISTFTVRPHFNSTVSLKVEALVVPCVCSYTPPQTQKVSSLLYLSHLNLADPAFLDKTEIDVLLGADIHAQIIQDSIVRGKPNEPIAMSSLLGWLISGSIPLNSPDTNSVSLHCTQTDSLSDDIEKFWRLEEVPPTKFITPADEQCEQHFSRTFKRDKDGRYIVKLPFKNPDDVELGDSYKKAVIMLRNMEKRFEVDPEFKRLYFDFIGDYISSGHMIPVPRDSSLLGSREKSYFLPHHGVLKPTSSTTKLRTVFNGSSKTSNNLSLNNLLHAGPNLLPELPNLICSWRLYKYVFVTDVKQMFRQIRIADEDQQYQAVVWRFNPNDPIQTYVLTTVTYGLVSSPYQATRTLRQLATDYQSVYPAAVDIVNKECYMDDMLSGGHTINQTLIKQTQLISLLKEGGFELRKWLSNDPKILENFPKEHLAVEPSVIFDDSSSIAVLGLNWQAKGDFFTFVLNCTPIEGHLSKRKVLSKIAQIFDPLGWLAPVTISAKVFMQSLWLLKCDWDKELPSEYVKRWEEWTAKLEAINSLKIPRFIGYSPEALLVEVHGFADASLKAYSAVIYLRIVSGNRVSTSLQIAKTKVAPLKTMSIPRLELSGAYILSKLASHFISNISIKIDSVHLWSDSKDVLFWLRSHPSRWQTFVANRCSTIITLLPNAYWHHVKSKDNPADVASRGVSPELLSEHELWWNGPSWLKQSSDPWPTMLDNLIGHNPIEGKPLKIDLISNVTTKTESPKNPIWDLGLRYASFSRLLRVTAYVARFMFKYVREKLRINPVHSRIKFSKFLNFSNVDSPFLTSDELHGIKLFWIYKTQQAYFGKEIQILSDPEKKASYKLKGALQKLNPFVKDDFLRVGGRLDQALLSFDNKHPYILPGDCFLSLLLIRQVHAKTLHGGVQLSLATLRQEFWLIKARQAVKKVLKECNVCVRYAAKVPNQLMGDLPHYRINISSPFARSGVDCAGPYPIRLTKCRGKGTMKGWVCLFVCLVTRGIHLELVEDYSAEAFIAAFHRFTSRWGHCSELVSDHGTNFTGADRELRRMFRKGSVYFKEICPYLVQEGTKWSWNPPGAPHFGGIWESGIKSTKYHIKRVIGESILTFSEMSTLLSRISACLNSRPLLPLSDDVSDINFLTPAHLLIQRESYLVPEPDFTSESIPVARRWQIVSQKLQHFWSRWRKEYLTSLQPRKKWHNISRSLQPGDVVYIRAENVPPGRWPLARVVKTYPDKHGTNRVCDLKTAEKKKIYRRPSVKLVLLVPKERELSNPMHIEEANSNLVLIQAAK